MREWLAELMKPELDEIKEKQHEAEMALATERAEKNALLAEKDAEIESLKKQLAEATKI